MTGKRSEFQEKESSNRLEARACDLCQRDTLFLACLRKPAQNPDQPKCEKAYTFQDKACQQGCFEQSVLLEQPGEKSRFQLKD